MALALQSSAFGMLRSWLTAPLRVSKCPSECLLVFMRNGCRKQSLRPKQIGSENPRIGTNDWWIYWMFCLNLNRHDSRRELKSLFGPGVIAHSDQLSEWKLTSYNIVLHNNIINVYFSSGEFHGELQRNCNMLLILMASGWCRLCMHGQPPSILGHVCSACAYKEAER